MPRAFNVAAIKREYETDPSRTLGYLTEAVQAGQLSLRDLSIRELFEATVEDGENLIRRMDPGRKSGNMRLQEAANAVDMSAFSNVTGQILYAGVKKEYELATMLADMLCTSRPSPFPYGERVPGVGGIGDQAETVAEGMPYPTVGMNEEYVDLPAPVKRGFIVPVTREILVYDRTQLVAERASKGAKWLGLNKEKRVIDNALGVTNTYKRNGTAMNTYLTSGAYINDKTSNALLDWTDIEVLELLFDAMTDPNTGEPIAWAGREMTLIVPTALLRTAQRLVNMTQIRFGDAASNTTAYYGTNPVAGATPGMSGGINVISSPYIKSRTTSATKWYYGNPKEAFVYNEVWGIEASQAPTGNSAQFERDIELQYKVSENGTPGTMEPRYMCRSDQ